MKCSNCGANISRSTIKCPYCGCDNSKAISDNKLLNHLRDLNRKEKKKIIREATPYIFYKNLKRINVILIIIFIFSFIAHFAINLIKGSFSFFDQCEYNVMKEYYDNNDFEALDHYLSENDGFDPESNYEFSQMAILYNSYISCQDNFARTYQEYITKGYYDTYYLERTVEEGLDVLIACPSWLYEDTTPNNAVKFKPYQDKIKILLTGILQIPEEMLKDLESNDYEHYDRIVNYVLGVLPNEEE